MVAYIFKRVLLAGFTMFVILFISYVMLRLSPGDPTKSSIFGGDVNRTGISANTPDFGINRSMREKLHLDKPIHVGFAIWLGNALRGDFGTSAAVYPGRSVSSIILERLPVTLKLNLFAIVITYCAAIPIGIFSAAWPNSFFDRASTVILFMLYSLPLIWVGLVLQSLLAAGGIWPIFPVKGIIPPYEIGQGWFSALCAEAGYYVLPVACLTYAGFAGISRYARGSMIDVLQQDYIRTAKAKGVSGCAILFHHAFRNSVVTLITLFSGILPGLVVGSIIVEHIFGIAGMGSLSLMSLSSHDYPLQMALFSFAGMLTLTGIFIADLLYIAADPGISFSGRRN